MKKRVYIYMLVIICGMFAFGCNKKEGNKLNNDEIIDNSNSIDNEKVDNEIEEVPDNSVKSSEYQIETLASLIDKTDEEVVNILGEGSGVFNQVPNTESYVREYSHVFEEEKVITTITYDNSNKVNGIYTYLPTYDWYKWEKVLTSKLGYPTKLSAMSTSSDMQIMRWRLDTTIITLFGLKDSLSIQLE